MGILIFNVTLRNCPPASAAGPPGESSSQTRSTPSGQQAPPSPDNTDSELPEERKAEEVSASGRGVSDQSTGGAMGTVRVAGGGVELEIIGGADAQLDVRMGTAVVVFLAVVVVFLAIFLGGVYIRYSK
ncbi:hypothetical protein CDEST_01656 [Colletotrichum destructivum]|uniref:Uncharacterized protein n=1 Tax=Colletotrichum destructivum TaxID=34406 RepID=A0AAX4HZY0_9PEZI|nr:hypothetical protein CDEST_01656 [Colletotrichum destructivum]